MKRRPCWVVLAPKQKTLAAAADGHEVLAGKGDYDAIFADEPGNEEEIAVALSKKQRAYVLDLHDDFPRVQAFVKGKYAGEIRAWPDSVAKQLKCTFPTCDGGRGKVDLTPHKSPDAKRGARKIGMWTIEQWKHSMETDDWSYLIDGAGKETCAQVLAALDDKQADVRWVAAKLANGISIYGEDKTFATKAVAKLRALEGDKDQAVRAEAKEAADDITEAIERKAIRAEFPWILNFDAKALSKALAILDDEREAVRRSGYLWWMNAWEVPKRIGKQVTTKLAAGMKRESNRQTRQFAKQALESVRARLEAQ